MCTLKAQRAITIKTTFNSPNCHEKTLVILYSLNCYSLFAQAGHRGHRYSKHQPVPELLQRIPLPRQHRRGLQPASAVSNNKSERSAKFFKKHLISNFFIIFANC